MEANWQTIAALVVVVTAAVLLVRSAIRKHNHHEGCNCPGAKQSAELSRLKKRVHRK